MIEFDKIAAFLKLVGFPTALAVWFLWKIQSFMDALLVQQTTAIELLRQLVELHRR